MKSVDNGAALLDERLPGWRDTIDPDTLRLDSGCNCILGQLFGEYSKGEHLLGVDNPEAYGFMRHGRATWDSLTRAWLRKLRA